MNCDKLEIRKALMINKSIQENIEELKKLTGNSEAAIIRIAVFQYYKSLIGK